MTSPPDPSRRRTVGEALQFLGMLTSVGGSLTILVRGFRSPFYFALVAIGIIMWFAGLYLRGGPKQD